MIRLIMRGRFTHDYAKGLIAAPEDREPALRKSDGGGRGQTYQLLLHNRRL